MEDIDVPVAWASTHGHTLPGVCARHGEPAEEIHHPRFGRTSPGWTLIAAVTSLVLAFLLGVAVAPMLAPLPVVAFVAIVINMRSIQVAWPYCARCVLLHHRVKVLGRVAGALTLLGTFAAVSRMRANGVDGTMLWVTAALLLAALVMALVMAAFSWQRLAGAQVSRDQLSVRVKAHPRFAAEVRERLAAERAAAGHIR
ncbi:hypothetical protein [Micromonospora sp. U21]|uniref:hypothetical protein n=1 Tax=Micromonospora sp. U21 TaxID=2824899 RepID=UPI001B36984B|nr:hypothetical protein [Micromonospora sp. U21]MBQ0905566.1 hypothetical protein [Micromonospora sp. U21]